MSAFVYAFVWRLILPSYPYSVILKQLKKKEVITYAQNERQQKPSQN